MFMFLFLMFAGAGAVGITQSIRKASVVAQALKTTPVDVVVVPDEDDASDLMPSMDHDETDMATPQDTVADDGMMTHEDMHTDDMDDTVHNDIPVEDQDHTASDHVGYDMVPVEPVVLETNEEVEAFVAAIKASGEMHVHDIGDTKMDEHMAALNLVPRDEATHIAIGSGEWDDPANWYGGEVPGDDAKVLIPSGISINYGTVSDARLFTVRVDGELDFHTDVDSQMVVDTLVVSPSGTLKMGTQEDPVDDDINIDIIFANNGPIDTDWDPMLLSRGMIAHGKVSIHGSVKDSHEKVIDDPDEGDTWLDFETAPEGWQVGDKIVIAGTHAKGWVDKWDTELGWEKPEDEERLITHIDNGRVFFDDPLLFDHDSPRDDLKVSVANYSRNVSFETENAFSAEIYERGHVMFMHSDDVDVRYAEFNELGRTDKSVLAESVGDFDAISFDSNVQGRYSFHFHRTGTENLEDPAIATGNAIYGSPGWGVVQHDSNAILDNNATYDTFGAGFVAESGNETGTWNDNIAIYAQGRSGLGGKLGQGDGLESFDLGRSGDGFWLQGRMINVTDNIAASVNNGFIFFHRGGFGDDKMTLIDAETSPIVGALHYGEDILVNRHPILSFSGNEVFSSRTGLYVLKGNTEQGHDVHSVLEDFTAWNIDMGVELGYTSHYILKDFDLIGEANFEEGGNGKTGIEFSNNTTDITVVGSQIENFDTGINLFKKLVNIDATDTIHEYKIVDPVFIDVENHYEHYDSTLDQILTSGELPNLPANITLGAPLTYSNVDRNLEIVGTKTDSLGETDFSSDADSYDMDYNQVIDTMRNEGYYTTNNGQNYFMLDLYFSDRISGDIYFETHPVLLDEDVNVESEFGIYKNVPFNGMRELDASDGIQTDAASLWAELTNGQIVLSEAALEMEDDESEDMDLTEH